MRAFVLMRQFALSHKELSDKLQELEIRFNKQFSDVYEAINYLLQKDKLEIEQKERRKIGDKSDCGRRAWRPRGPFFGRQAWRPRGPFFEDAGRGVPADLFLDAGGGVPADLF